MFNVILQIFVLIVIIFLTLFILHTLRMSWNFPKDRSREHGDWIEWDGQAIFIPVSNLKPVKHETSS